MSWFYTAQNRGLAQDICREVPGTTRLAQLRQGTTFPIWLQGHPWVGEILLQNSMSPTPNAFFTELRILDNRKHSKQTVIFKAIKKRRFTLVCQEMHPSQLLTNRITLSSYCDKSNTERCLLEKHQCLLMFDWWGERSSWCSPYHPNMYSIALVTTPVLLVGVFVPGTTLFSPWASLRMKFRQQTL